MQLCSRATGSIDPTAKICVKSANSILTRVACDGLLAAGTRHATTQPFHRWSDLSRIVMSLKQRSCFRQKDRHCEPTGRREAPPDDRLREAIHLARVKKEWIASSQALLATTWLEMCLRNLAARLRPRFAKSFAQRRRGRRECRVHAAPAVSCAIDAQGSAHEHTGSAEAVRHSLRNGFTAYAALSPATNSSCHRHCRLDG